MGTLLLTLPALFGGGILVSVFLRNHRAGCAAVHAILSFVAALLILYSSIGCFTGMPDLAFTIANLPTYGSFSFGLDALTSLFLIIYLVSAGIFALSEVRKTRGGIMNAAQWSAYGLLSLSVCGVLMSRDMMSFLILWEFVTIATGILLLFRSREHLRARTAWLYLFFSHLSLVILMITFAILRAQTGSYSIMDAINMLNSFPVTMLNVLFFLPLLAFGCRCGLFPFYFWIAPASSYPPIPVSGLLVSSGLNLGLYGLLRFSNPFLLTPEVWWGPVLLLFGLLTIAAGALSAVVQTDIKQQSGYAAVTHVGMIVSGFGLAFTAAYYHYPDEAVLILSGIMLLTINLSVVQPALLLASNTVGKANGSFNINHGGGLARQYPTAGTLYGAASMSCCFFPPFGGFLAPTLILLAVIQLLTEPHLPSLLLFALIVTAAVFSAVSLLLSLTYLKSFGLFFLGRPRTPEGQFRPPIDPMLNVAMTIQLVIVVLMMVFMPLFSKLMPALLAPITEVAPDAIAASLVKTASVSVRYIWLIALALCAIALGFRLLMRISAPLRCDNAAAASPPWNGGFLPPAPRAAYSAFSFSKPFTDMIPKIVAEPAVSLDKGEILPSQTEFKVSNELNFQIWIFKTFPDYLNRLALRIQSIEVGRIHFYLCAMILTILIIIGIKWL